MLLYRYLFLHTELVAQERDHAQCAVYTCTAGLELSLSAHRKF